MTMEEMLVKDFPSIDDAETFFEGLAEENGGFEKDPRAALMLFHMKSGLEAQFYDPIDNLKIPTAKDAFECLRRCQEKIGQEAQYCACAGCQMRCVESECTKHRIGDSKLGHLLHTQEKRDKLRIMTEFGKSAHTPGTLAEKPHHFQYLRYRRKEQSFCDTVPISFSVPNETIFTRKTHLGSRSATINFY